MFLNRYVLAALCAFIISPSAFAHEKVCFGTEENRGNRVVLEMNAEEVEVLEADSRGVDISVGNKIDHLLGRSFSKKNILNGKHRYDMGSEFGGSALLLIDTDLVNENRSTGSAVIRSAGDNGLLYIRLFCRNNR